jgi:hypothetical protein
VLNNHLAKEEKNIYIEKLPQLKKQRHGLATK